MHASTGAPAQDRVIMSRGVGGFVTWDVQIEGAIEAMEGAIALEQCMQYDRLCDLVHRAPGSGSLWRSRDGYVYETAWNLGELHSRGIDVAWDW